MFLKREALALLQFKRETKRAGEKTPLPPWETSNYRGFLDAEWKRWGTCCIKKRQSVTACEPEHGSWAGWNNDLPNEAEENRFENETAKRVSHSYAQGKHDQGVLGIIARLEGVIPVV
jgi:hypothetical protein